MRSPNSPGIVITRCKGNRATKTRYSPVAQLAEHSTVNRRVTGSSPVGGAKLKASELRSEAFPFSRRDSNAVTTALGAGAGAPTPNFVWSSPVEGAHKARIPKASPWGFLLYLFLWLEPVTTPPYVSAGAPAPGSVWFESRATGICRRKQRFLVPRALGKTVTPLCRVQSNRDL